MNGHKLKIDYFEKRKKFRLSKNISKNMNEAWMLAGYFNDIACPDEKRGGAVVSIPK